MDANKYLNALRIMHSLDEVGQVLDRDMAAEFHSDPARAAMRMDDETWQRVYALIEARQRPRRRSRAPIGECAYCDELRADGAHFAPPHDASPDCQSSKHSHCSCDTCF
jgi:hypothetical protein